MALKLSKAQRAKRDEFVTRLNEASGKISTAVDEFNSALETLKAPIEAAVEAYNEIVVEAKEFTDEIAGDADNEISEKSDTWQEGERGQAAVGWKDEWQSIDLDEIEVELPDEISFDEPLHADDLESAPEGTAT
jgi:hypothetical protein